MKYLLVQLIILLLSVIILLYLSSLSYFLPYLGENINWYSVSIILVNIFFLTESFFSLLIFLIQKFLLYEKSEFPPFSVSLKWGIVISFCVIISLFLSIFNIIPLIYALISWAIILIVIYLLKIV
jgi:hypothetical protein